MPVQKFTPGRSPIDAIANALQLVNAVYGIKANSAALDKARAESERAATTSQREDAAYEDQQAGVISEERRLGLAQYYDTAKEGEAGARPVQVRQGDSVLTEFVKPKKKEVDPLASLWKQGQADRYANTLSSELRKEYVGLPTTKQTQDVASAMERIRGAGENPSPAGDISLIFNFMKMNDPGSTVREGEYATAQNAAGVPDRVRNAWNKAINGQPLNPKQREDFIDQAGRLYNAQLSSQKNVENHYVALAKKRGADPADVILPFTPYQSQRKQSGGGFPGVSDASASQGKSGGQDEIFPGIAHDSIAEEKARRAAVKAKK